MTLSADVVLLGLTTETPTTAEVRAAYKVRALELHPDRGGSAEAFDALARAYDRLLRRASQPRPCGTCRGKGKLAKKTGFRVAYHQCRGCGGKGRVKS